jgi:hypothetical protein
MVGILSWVYQHAFVPGRELNGSLAYAVVYVLWLGLIPSFTEDLHSSDRSAADEEKPADSASGKEARRRALRRRALGGGRLVLCPAPATGRPDRAGGN